MLELVELSLVIAVGSLAACWVVYTRLTKRIKDLEAQVELTAVQPNLQSGLSEEIRNLLEELETSSEAAARRFQEKASLLQDLSETASVQIEILKSVQVPEETEKRPPEPLPVLGTADVLPLPSAGDKAEVVALAKQGMSPVDIAREVGLSRGEVELLLQLYRKPKKSSGN